MEEKIVSSFELPGFRFHPTEEELLDFYLKNMVNGKNKHLDIICFLDIYRHDPWDLPGLAKIGEREWYFFVPRDKKHSNGGRPNRTTEHGFWKATGSDRKVVTLSEPKRVIGLRKTLVFYQGRAPRGSKTDWVMNEYRLPDNYPKDIVLCKIYRKATSLKELEQRAAKEEEKSMVASYPTSPLSSSNGTTTSFFGGGNGQLEDLVLPMFTNNIISMSFKNEEIRYNNHCNDDEIVVESSCKLGANTLQLPFGRDSLGELQVPKSTMDWATLNQDPLWAQSCSPWLENLLNFTSPTIAQFLSI